MFWENGNLKKFLILQETELSELEKWKEPTLKMFLILWGKKCSSSKLKKTPVFLGEPISAFHHCFLSCFHFTTDFYYYFWVFSLLIAFVNFINFRVFHHCLGGFILLLIFTIVFRVFSFYKLSFPWLVFCVDVPWVLWIGESIFYSQVFFSLHSFPTFGTTCFYQDFSASRQFFLEGCRVSHWVLKHRPGQFVCLNHTVFSKKYWSAGSTYVLRLYKTLYQTFLVSNPLFNS